MRNPGKKIFLFIIIAILATYSSSARAGTELTVGIEKMSGETWYQIGGTATQGFFDYDVHFPISELRFPLDVYMVSVGGSIEFLDRFTATADLAANVTDDAGDAEDSDWGAYFLETGDPYFSTSSLDIYSLSNAQLTAVTFDMGLRYRFFTAPVFSLSAGLGYRYQNFEYDLSDLDQWYPSSTLYFGYDLPHDRVPGKVATYEVTYGIPYAEISGRLKAGKKMSFEASLGYAPYVTAEDTDDHILRSILATTDAEGDALLMGLSGRFDFTQRLFGTIEVDYMTVNAEGTEYNYVYAGRYAGDSWTIDHNIESEQISIRMSAGFSF